MTGLAKSVFVLLALLFGLQVFSPLRLNTDAIVLLSMADSAAQGNVLVRIGLAHSWAIISLNLIFLCVGLFAAYVLLVHEFFADKTVVLIMCSLFFLSFVVA